MRKWIVMFLSFLCFTLGFSTVWASQVVDESDVLTAEQETELNNSLGIYILEPAGNGYSDIAVHTPGREHKAVF